jgi:hypothetical protein
MVRAGLQYRVKSIDKILGQREWSEWRWITGPDALAFTGVNWESVYFQFRWADFDNGVPFFTRDFT